jgi:hypothetical protein
VSYEIDRSAQSMQLKNGDTIHPIALAGGDWVLKRAVPSDNVVAEFLSFVDSTVTEITCVATSLHRPNQITRAKSQCKIGNVSVQFTHEIITTSVCPFR